MEDAQLSHLDSDTTAAPSGGSTGRPSLGAATPYAPVSHYMDSSKESFSDTDDNSSLWKCKQQKCFKPPPKSEQLTTSGVLGYGKRIEAQWPLGILGVEGAVDRTRRWGTYNYLPGDRLEMTCTSRYQITEDDPHEKAPKKDLIAQGVRIIGNKKANELIEMPKRTPGGVFPDLLGNIPSVENQKEYEHEKAARKRTQVGTNEALASLDNPQKATERQRWTDAEDAIDIHHPHHLDTF
ncbi:unnamed protein product [Nyctereutes procyonoides]|uniref:(raccoon dog) hypothetical protein n=1 Tax=Nyctereutes procyonoides TaxID=34880 RepID=A0A811Y0P3_NYCPR|nr:unnamed protein product [Nyctereutes procyonoides]